MDGILVGSAYIKIPGGKNYRFTSQRVIRSAGNNPPYPGYSKLSAIKNDLRRNFSGYEVAVKGVITDMLSHQVLPDTRIEVWHRSAKVVGEFHRARFTTDECGQFFFRTDWPEREKGKNYSIFFKITYEQNSYFTKMYFNHSLALLSTLNNHSKSYNSLHRTASPTVSNKIGACLQFNIGIPADMIDPTHSQALDIHLNTV